MASDSRLSGGRSWDCCPKILPLPRGDSAIAFAGMTEDAYPLMLQMFNAVLMHRPSLERTMDLREMKGHTVRVFNDMRLQIQDLPVGKKSPEAPDAIFILGGYSWEAQSFEIWILHYDSHIGKFTFRPIRPWGPRNGSQKRIAITGSGSREAKARLIELLRDRNKLSSGSFDMEPFEVLRDMIVEKVDRTVGGPPQMIKIYRSMNVVPFGIKWQVNGIDRVCVGGRPLLEYEAPHVPILDPFTMAISHFYKKGA